MINWNWKNLDALIPLAGLIYVYLFAYGKIYKNITTAKYEAKRKSARALLKVAVPIVSIGIVLRLMGII